VKQYDTTGTAKEPGQVAYEAYHGTCDVPRGFAVFRWREISDEARADWVRVEQSVLAASKPVADAHGPEAVTTKPDATASRPEWFAGAHGAPGVTLGEVCRTAYFASISLMPCAMPEDQRAAAYWEAAAQAVLAAGKADGPSACGQRVFEAQLGGMTHDQVAELWQQSARSDEP